MNPIANHVLELYFTLPHEQHYRTVKCFGGKKLWRITAISKIFLILCRIHNLNSLKCVRNTLEIHVHNIGISLNNGNTHAYLAISLNKLRNTCVAMIWIHFHKSGHKWR